MNLTFFSLCTLLSDSPCDFESGDGVLGVGEAVCGACPSASGGGRVGIGGSISSAKGGFVLCGVDSKSAMVRRIIKSAA